jgi:E3 ubiquitin-protein ligase TRIP12
LIAKALQDNRLLDINLSPLLYKLLACPAASVGSLLTRTELSQVDPALAKTVSKLSAMLEQKQAAESNSSLSPAKRASAIAAINYDGAPLESLYLDFTCPGHPDVELCEGGTGKAVTLDNLEEYIEAVVDATLGRCASIALSPSPFIFSHTSLKSPCAEQRGEGAGTRAPGGF